MSNIAYLSLGSNMGDRVGFLQAAVQALHHAGGIDVKQVSSIYETDPVGYVDQAQFLNIAIKITTDLDPFVLLDHCLQVEEELGRVREFRWGPRVIDVDVLLYNDEVIESERLRVPHPRMKERSFVLIPLLEIHADLVDPSSHRPYSTILSSLTDKESVRKWKEVQDVHEFL